MARTKMEIDALVNVIRDRIVEERKKAIKKVLPEARKKYLKLKPLLAQQKELAKKTAKLNSKIQKLIGNGWIGYQTKKDQAYEILARTIIGAPDILDKQTIRNQVVLAGDQGADVLIKKITAMFV